MREFFRRQCARMFSRLVNLLADQRMPVVGAALALVLTLPALRVGLSSDDLLHRAVLVGSPEAKPLFPTAVSMFEFLDGDPQRMMRMIDRGMMPWWAVTDMKASFWRPITVATHWLDYHLWPQWPVIMHLHSLAWFAGFVLLTGLLYRRLAGPGLIAGLAALLFALDDAHATPAAWLANRNIVIAGVFGVCCLLAHDRWRRNQSKAAAVVAPFLLLASLLAAEGGISTCAYLAAYAFCLDRGTIRQRGLTLLPAFIVVVAWRIVWTMTGHGVVGAGFYVDPLHDPMGFFAALIQRAPILLLAQFAFPPAELGLILRPPGIYVFWALAVAVTLAFFVLFLSTLRRSPLARFWALGMTLALPPMCTTFTSDRMLYFIGIGAMGLLAEFLVEAWSPLHAAASRYHGTSADASGHDAFAREAGRCVRVVAWGLVAIHLVLSPAVLAVRARFPIGPDWMLPEQLYRVTLDPSVERRDLCIINAPHPAFAAHVLLQREYEGQPVPKRLRVIAPALAPVRVSRPDERTLVVAPADGFGDRVLGRLFRDKDRPMRPGERLELTGLSIEVLRVGADGMPAEAVFRFGVPLEDRSLYWLYWDKDHLVPWMPPIVAQTIELGRAIGFE